MPIKLINYGQSGHGKTGALASLCAAGFQVRVFDLEAGIETLVNILNDPGRRYPAEAIRNLQWVTLTEKMRVLNGNFVPQGSTVWPRMTDMLGTKWRGARMWNPKLALEQAKAAGREPSEDELKGYAEAPSDGGAYSWGSKHVLCIDTLSSAAERALEHNLMMQGMLGNSRTSMEGMRDAGSAQGKIDKFLQFLRDDNLKCNIVVNTHINWAKEDGKAAEPGYEGQLYAFPSAIGKALNTQIGKHFNHMLMTRKVGMEYEIRTRGVPGASLKSGAPFRVKERYGLANGLAEYFADVGKV